MDILRHLEQKALEIRLELGRLNGLSDEQMESLPSITQLHNFAVFSVDEILPSFHESIYNQDEMDFLENGLGANHAVPPTRDIELNAAQANQWEILSRLALFATEFGLLLEHEVAIDNFEGEQLDHATREIDTLAAYEGFCSEIINSRNESRCDRSIIGGYLLEQFLMPPDLSARISGPIVVDQLHILAMREIFYVPLDNQIETEDGFTDANGNPICGHAYVAEPSEYETGFACDDFAASVTTGPSCGFISDLEEVMKADQDRGTIAGTVWEVSALLCARREMAVDARRPIESILHDPEGPIL